MASPRKRRNWAWDGSGGCGPIGYADGRTALDLGTYSVRGRQLSVADSDAGTCDRRLPSEHVSETARFVDLLVVSPKPRRHPRPCVGEGVSLTLHTTLRSTVGDRTVRNIGYLPTRILLNQTQAAAAQRQYNASYRTTTGVHQEGVAADEVAPVVVDRHYTANLEQRLPHLDGHPINGP